MTRKSANRDDYFICIKNNDVELFGLNAAAILSVIKAGDKWRIETNHRNKNANDIAEMHGDNRWLSEDVSLRFTIQDFIQRIFGICGRTGVMEALKKLEAFGVIEPHANPIKKYTSDKGRYFRFHRDIYDKLVQQLKDGIHPDEILERQTSESQSICTDEYQEVPENTDRLNLDDAPFKNKRDNEGCGLNLNAPRLNLDSHIMNSNNINNINKSINARATDHPNFENTTADIPIQVKAIITALINEGMPAKRFYPDTIDEIQRLHQAGATVEVFIKAYVSSVRATQGRGFGIPYLSKVIHELLTKPPKQTTGRGQSPPQPKDKYSDTVYESDTRNALKWMKGGANASTNGE